MRSIIYFLLFSTFTFGQEKNQILMVGTFHFHLTPYQIGADFNIEDEQRQKELNDLVQTISNFRPTKIFVEWKFDKQSELDELYQLFKKDKNFESIKKKYGENETMYYRSEIQQLGFRLADRLNHLQLYAFDYELEEPNDTIMKALQSESQQNLALEIQNHFAKYAESLQTQFARDLPLKELLLFFNSVEFERQINSGYLTYFNRIGELSDFAGSYFVSERFKRNLYMYSLIQKQVSQENERILIIVGAQHSAGIKEFIKNDEKMELVELESILK